jgi:quercetin dioxygenase-like cupin family protein
MSDVRHGAFDDVPVEHAFEGVDRRRVDGRNMTLLRYRFAARAAHELHSHPEEQTMLIEEGTARVHVDGDVIELGAGDWAVVPPHVRHGLEAGPEDTRLLVVVSPRRTQGYDTTPLPAETDV